MSADEKEVMAIVERINGEIIDSSGDSCPLFLIFGTTGYAWDVSVGEQQVFCSENDSRRYDEESDTEESWEACIRRVLKERAVLWARAFGVSPDDLKAD